MGYTIPLLSTSIYHTFPESEKDVDIFARIHIEVYSIRLLAVLCIFYNLFSCTNVASDASPVAVLNNGIPKAGPEIPKDQLTTRHGNHLPFRQLTYPYIS